VTATLRPGESAAALAAAAPSGAEPEGRTGPGDGVVVACLLAAFTLITLLTWRKWGNPEIDAGAELSTADLVAHGSVPYLDVRYFYGPLGLYSLAGAFKLFGASFTVAYAFGLAQAGAILGVFYLLARRWLPPVTAGLGTAVLLAIGFSGTAFNFVLPHTNSATFGVLFLLLQLLALAHRRVGLAGLAAGLVCLTRPEFAAVAAGVGVAWVLGTLRDDGLRAALRAAAWLAVPALVVAGSVLGTLAAVVGTGRLVTENLWPVDFIRVAGFRSQSHWMPFDLASAAGLVARAAIYLGALAAVVAAAERWRLRRGLARVAGLWPLAAALLVLALVDGAARATGVFGDTRSAVEGELRHLLIGMSWLPALALGAAAWALVLFVRRRPAPLSDSWALDLALLAAASALGLRAYNAFTAEGSYAPYYAAPLVLVLAILHQRVAERHPLARPAVLAMLGAVAVGLSAYAVVGLYADASYAVHTPRGTFVTQASAGPGLQRALDRVDATTRPGEPILAAPSDGGFYFMADRPPAVYEIMLLPGLLDSRADERRVIRRLRARGVRVAVVGARDFGPFGFKTFGTDYNQVLGTYLHGAASRVERVGDLSRPAAGTYPSRGFEILHLRR
jgi:hypothetical protein